MAENINIDFMPNRKTADTQRVGAVEDYLKLFTDRAKFCFSSIYDELSDIGKRLDSLDDFTISTPSSVDLTVENAVILQEKESQQVIHNFTKVHYVDGNSVGYGDIQNSIICNGYTIRANNDSLNPEDFPYYEEMTFAKSGSIRVGGSTIKSSATDIKVYTETRDVAPSGIRTLLGVFRYTDNETGERRAITLAYTTNTYMTKWGIFPYWETINPPTEEFPYGLVELGFATRFYDGSEWESLSASNQVRVNIPFASEAEYNAAVGLTNTPIELIKIQDFQYLVPESQIIVDKELSPDSDNVIANSTVAKALSLKADKETVETLSLVVDSKADIIELDALSQKVEGKADAVELEALAEIVDEKADSATVSALSETVDGKAEKSEVQLISQELEGKAELSDLNFIGENMLENATFHSNFAKWHFTNNNFSEITVKDNFPCAHFSGGIGKSTSVRQSVLEEIDKENLDQLYTFSADIRLDDYVAGTTNPFAQLYFSATYDNNGTSSAFNATTVAGSPELSQYSGQGWKKVYWTVRFARVPNSIYAFVYARDFTGELYFKNLKLEKGSVPTAYTPSVTDYTELVDRVAVLEASLLSLGGEL